MRYEIKPVLSKDEYQHKREVLFNNESFDKILYWIANDVMRGKI